ncbi:TonB-dependent receptor [Flavobacteriaceae bacterium TP-CH-4]|uniref:TonB-dependent receptor n=1 Tax=Pelagihabitans pacificus TaxID=2696054 RepID=A0A967E435_9FLAO|nr:TonB-dependent receptor [Pelagihabitans pacificus]NHF57992.1 TonB-dependent receptor [Pelagihabitans pacificus]
MQKHISFVMIFLLGVVSIGNAQEEERDLGTETVTVTKAYSPTISDAFKIKSMPNLNDSIVLQKKKIEYSIFSVPVASTFTPAKGKASRVKKVPPPELFNSYASAGGGNPANLMAKFYTSRTIDRESGYTVGLSHNSSRGDIAGVILDNVYSDTEFEGSYKKRDRDFDWGFDIGAQHQLYNWYGLPPDTFDPTTFGGIDERQNYFMAEAGGHINVEDSYFKSARLRYRRFWDAVKSGENRIVFQPAFEFPVSEETFGIALKVDYVNGSFENAPLNLPTNDMGSNYSNLQVGVNPSLTMLRDDLSLNLGVNIVYGFDAEQSDSNFYIYPAVTASYRLLDEFAIVYGGIEGALRQNSYYGFVEENPFVSPTFGLVPNLNIVPTDQQYDAYLGLRGQLLPNLSYNVKGSYIAENRRPLFLLNPQNTARTDEKGYYFGNSFTVFYDDIGTLGVFGELNVDVNRNFTMGVNAEYFNYNTESDNPAWNLPEVTASLFMDYQIGEKWFMGANLFYVGEREDVATVATPSGIFSEFPATILTLDSFFDANVHVGHRLSNQLSVFLKGANLANNNYQRWANFPVQGLQVLAGATYKFDF